MRAPRRFVLALGLLTGIAAAAHARPPEIRNIDLRGLQIGAPTPLTIDGLDLLPAPRLFLNEKPVDIALDPRSTPTRAILTITLPDTTPAGIGTLRLATGDGFSNGIPVGLDRLPQSVMAAETKAIPASLHGSVPGSGVSRTTFPGKAGEDVLIEVEAKRLGSKLRPVVHLYDARRTQLAWALPSNTLSGDCRAAARLPADGLYTVEVHDMQYGPPGPSYFRLKIGRWEFADLAFPPAVARGQETVLQLIGKVATASVPFKSSGEELLAPVPLNSPSVSGPPPSVAVTSVPETLAQPQPENAPQPLAAPPIAVSGRLNTASQRHRYLVPVKAGQKLAFEVFAERFGSRIDSILDLRNKQGGVLAQNDDLPAIPGVSSTTDSRIEFTVPEGLDAVEVGVRDALETANEAAIYRLVITSVDTPTADFEAVAKVDVANVPAGEKSVFEVFVRRENYDGPIQLQVPDLPPGLTLEGADIPARATGTLLTFVNAGADPATARQFITRIRAQSPDGKIVRCVRFESTADDRTPAWLRERIALAATPRNAPPFTVEWTEAAPATQFVLTTKFAGQLRITRPPAATAASYGPVRLTLLVSQNPPRVNGQLNPAFNIRQERPIELPIAPAVKAAGDAYLVLEKQHADAVMKAAAAQGDAKVAAEKVVQDLTPKKEAAAAALKDAESKAAYTTDFPVLLVATTIDPSCDLSVKAELLSTDRGSVLRTAYAPVRRLPVVNPLALKLATAGPVEATLDPKTGAALKIDGRIERLADYKGAVTVLVAGLPPGVSLPAVAVPADKSDFQLDLRLPPNFAAAEIKGIKLTAQGPGDPFSGQPLKAAEVELTVKVTKVPETK